MPADVVRAHVWVKGMVQNVGFRAHVEYYANEFKLTGWVRNVGYDTVEAVAEGERASVQRWIETVQAGPRASRVDEGRVEWETVTGEFKVFDVRRSL